MLYPAELRAPKGLIAGLALSVILLTSVGRATPVDLVVSDQPGRGAFVLRTPDGQLGRLEGIAPIVPLAEAASVARAWLDAGPVDLAPVRGGRDRHGEGRIIARRGSRTLQEHLVSLGLAAVAPRPGASAVELEPLFQIEAEARSAGRGGWARGEAGPFPAATVHSDEGRWVLIEGRVAEVARAREFVYVNFGSDYRRDATLRVDAAEVRRFARAGLDLMSLGGRSVRARGYLFENGGPMIEITHPMQVEVLP